MTLATMIPHRNCTEHLSLYLFCQNIVICPYPAVREARKRNLYSRNLCPFRNSINKGMERMDIGINK